MTENSDNTLDTNQQSNDGNQLPPPIGEENPRKGKKGQNLLQQILTGLGIGLLLLAIGAGVVYFRFYIPSQSALAAAQAELETTTTSLSTTQSDLEFAQGRITSLESELGSMTTQQAASERVAYALGAYAEVSSARLALANSDVVSARISLANAASYLTQLEPFIEDTEISSGLSDRLMSARSHLSGAPETAADELGTLGGNLLNLIQGYLAGN